MRTLGQIIDDVEAEANGATVAALVVRFQAWNDYVFVGDNPPPLERLRKMVIAGGDPIALVVAKQTSSTKAAAYVRLLAEYADDQQLLNQLGQLAEDFRAYVKEHGLRELRSPDEHNPTELFKSAYCPDRGDARV